MSMMNNILCPQKGFKLGYPTWKQFGDVIRQPRKAAPGPDKISPHLLQWLPKELQWDLYQAILDVWGTGEIPSHWLEARLSLLYKKGNATSAMNYRPISVSNCICIVLAWLILDAIQQPINTALSGTQAGSRKSYTISQQAMNLLMDLHERPEGSYICLLDIAKAFPRTPHVCLVESLQAIGAPPPVSRMVKSIYTLSACQYGELRILLHRGIKEGCPLSPALFVLVYETFHATLAKEFPEASFFVYVDDIVVVTKNANNMQRVLKRVQELSLILGFQTNPGKTEVYKWATTPRARQKRHVPQHDVLRWNGKDRLVRPPIFTYLGHIIAHPLWAQRARDEVLAKVESDLPRYRTLPLNAFERVHFLNSVLIPRWMYHTMFIPHDRMFQHIDKICL